MTSFTNRINAARSAIAGRSMDGIERRTVPFSSVSSAQETMAGS